MRWEHKKRSESLKGEACCKCLSDVKARIGKILGNYSIVTCGASTGFHNNSTREVTLKRSEKKSQVSVHFLMMHSWSFLEHRVARLNGNF